MDKDGWQKRGQGHRERLRQRFLEGGLERFSDEEVIEFLLTLGTPRGDLKLPAREALNGLGSLSGVLSAPMEQLTRIKGIGPKNALYLKLVHQVAGRYLKDRAMGKAFFDSSQAVFDYLLHAMRDLKREVFKALFFDSQKRIAGGSGPFPWKPHRECSLSAGGRHPGPRVQGGGTGLRTQPPLRGSGALTRGPAIDPRSGLGGEIVVHSGPGSYHYRQ